MRKGTNHVQEQVQQEGARERRLLVLAFALKDGSIFAAGFAVMIFSTKIECQTSDRTLNILCLILCDP